MSASLTIKYARSTSNSTEPTTWQDSIPTLTPTEKYLWAQFMKTEGLSSRIWTGIVGVYGDKGDKGDKGDPGEPGEDGADGQPGEKGDTGDTGLGFLYYNGTGLHEDEAYIGFVDLGKPYGYMPQIGDLVLCADGWVFTIEAIVEDIGGVEVSSTGICLMGEPGKDGANGKDGTSATHSWNGTVLTVTSASGTSSANLKGDKGDTGAEGPKGDTGATGKDGNGIKSIRIEEVS